MGRHGLKLCQRIEDIWEAGQVYQRILMKHIESLEHSQDCSENLRNVGNTQSPGTMFQYNTALGRLGYKTLAIKLPVIPAFADRSEGSNARKSNIQIHVDILC